MTFSKWFPIKTEPEWIGVYQTRTKNDVNTYYSYWNGKMWCGEWWTIERALNNKTYYGISATQWRGIKK